MDPDGYEAVANFEKYFRYTYYGKNYSVLRQSGKTNMNYVCGAMAFLIVYNHFSNVNNTTPDFVKDNTTVINKINDLYMRLGKSKPGNNTASALSGELLRCLVTGCKKGQKLSTGEIVSKDVVGWGWPVALINSSYTYKTNESAYSAVRTALGLGRLVITLMKANSDFVPSKKSSDIAAYRHFIVLYSADAYNVKYADPWYGTLVTKPKASFLAGWSNRYWIQLSNTTKK